MPWVFVGIPLTCNKAGEWPRNACECNEDSLWFHLMPLRISRFHGVAYSNTWCSLSAQSINTNTNRIYNAHKVTTKCESETRIVSHQVKSQFTFQFLERYIRRNSEFWAAFWRKAETLFSVTKRERKSIPFPWGREMECTRAHNCTVSWLS